MERLSKELVVAGLTLVLILNLSSWAPAQDADGDGVTDANDICPETPFGQSVDLNGCPDDDEDGVADANDVCGGTPEGHTVEPNGCSDDDLDGVFGHVDNCPDDYNPGQEDNDDGDGAGDICDICPQTDPQWAQYPYAVTAEGCRDEDQDGFSDYADLCPDTVDPRWQHDFLLDRGCLIKRWVHVRSRRNGQPEPVYYAYSGDRWHGWGGAKAAPGADFILQCPAGPEAGVPNVVYLGNPNVESPLPTNGVWFRLYEGDNDVRLWNAQNILDANEIYPDDPPMQGYSTQLDFYDLPPHSFPTEPCQIVSAGNYDPEYDGITITIWEVYDSDGDGIIDAEDGCPDTPPHTQMDPCNPGCPLPDADGDGVPDAYPEPHLGNGGEYIHTGYPDLCPDSDPCHPVNQDGCQDVDRDGVADTDDNCPDSPLGTTVSLEGCSDADGDGMYVPYDKCEDQGSPINSDGCTDTDGDGVPDTDDLCPDPCTWVDDNGCPDRDLDGVPDADDNCPDTGGLICPDGCPDADDDGDGVPDCVDLCDDPCTWVDKFGCPDADRDGVNNANDNCPGSTTVAVGPDGCKDNENILFETDGKNTNGDTGKLIITYLDLALKPGQHPDYPDGLYPGLAGHMPFSVKRHILPYTHVWYRIYTDGETAIWDVQDLDFWHKQRTRPGGDPITGSRKRFDRRYGASFELTGYPTSKFYHTVVKGALPDWPFPIHVKVVENIDTDGDGVQDPIDECPDTDPNGQFLIDEVGCEVWPACDDPWRPSPGADIDVDCYVDENDVIALAEQWLSCIEPLGDDCIQLQPSPEQMYPDLMYMPHCWDRSVDALLTDWPDPCWIALDQIYAPDPNDLLSAKYAVCWDPCDDKFYAAIVVEDSQHVFESAPTNWNTCDRAEIYVQADPNGGENWGSTSFNTAYDTAQQYVVGYQGIIQGWAWSVFGHGTYIPGDIEPGDADFDDAARISGDTITYEISAKAWQWYGGRYVPTIPSVPRPLEPGIHVGFDLAVGSRWGPEPHNDAAEYGMLSANQKTQKFIHAKAFQRWELLDYDGTKVPPECGDWGYLTADVNPIPDCYVDMTDFEQLSSQWMDCTDPCAPCGFIP